MLSAMSFVLSTLAPGAAAIGIWQIPPSERRFELESRGSRMVVGPGVASFAYDGQHVVMMLFTEKEWMWRSEDDFYKLRSRWSGDRLEYLPPFADWQPLATFRDGAFFDSREPRHTWRYRKVRPEELTDEERPLVAERAPHDYRVKPTDPAIPAHLRHFPGLYLRKGAAIVDAPAADQAVARAYPTFAQKGPVARGLRLTIMTAATEVARGQEVRVIHVLEAVEPGHQVYVMGPKPVYDELVDGEPVTPAFPGPGVYDGAVMKSPWADYNYEITSYRFDQPGTHTIQWRGGDPSGESGGLASNALTITVR